MCQAIAQDEEDYMVAKAWRLISLLAMLGKVLELVVAERISHAVEIYGLLLTNHFGVHKQSAEQALLLLQEQIYTGLSDHQPSQFQCQRGLQQSLQRKTAPENEGMRHTREAAPVDRGILLRMNGNNPNQK